MSGKVTARTRVIGILACLAVVAGLMAVGGAQARAAASFSGARAGAGPAPAAPPADTVNLSPDYVNQTIGQMEAQFGDDYSAVAEAEGYTRAAAADQQKATELATQYQTLTGDISADNQRAATLTAQQSSDASQASALEGREESLNEQIEVHNGEPHDFEIPQQQAEADAYQEEADELNSQVSALESEATTVSGEISGVEDAENQLADDEDALDEQIDAYNEQVTELADSLQQLEGEVQGLMEQGAQAEQDAEEAPAELEEQTGQAASASPSAAMNAGGDAVIPPQAAEQALGQAVGQDTGTPGGDIASVQPQVAALTQYAAQTGTSVITEPGTAVLTPGSISALPASQAARLGSPVVSYDGLVREQNGQYEALVVQAPGETLTPQQQALESAVRRGGRAATTVGGVPEFINSLIYVKGLKVSIRRSSRMPYPTSPGAADRSPGDEATCLTQKAEALTEGGQNDGSGWILNRSQGVDHVNKDTSPKGGRGIRAEDGVACLTADHDKKRDGTKGLKITGYQDASRELTTYTRQHLVPGKELARCHVIADILGGLPAGKNLFPCYQVGLNTGLVSMKSPFEDLVRAIAGELPANSGAAVLYLVTLNYKSAESTVPEGVFLNAELQEPGGVTYPIFQEGDYLDNIRLGGGPPLGN